MMRDPAHPVTSKPDRPTAIVTGGSSGIGLAVALDLSRDHSVFVLGRNLNKLLALNDHEHIHTVQLDICDAEATAKFAARVSRVDVLVHSAAVSGRSTAENASIDQWQETFAINLFAPAELTRLLLPKLRSAQGQVVFVNSGAGLRAIGGRTVYSASKFALKALADALRQEEAAAGVRVATVFPGPTDTPMNRKDREANSEPITDTISDPEAYADAVRVIVNIEKMSQITDLTVRPRFNP
ncbi:MULTISPECIES: SDR family oxidoreductase [Gluconobacter]|uniref:SDR family oxidoreductase n=1 Tax=Gluconobacter TaxID=441 RepID=UPI0039E8C35D